MSNQKLVRCVRGCGKLHEEKYARAKVCKDEVQALKNTAQRVAKKYWFVATKEQLQAYFFKKYPRAQKIIRRAKRIDAL